MATTYLGKIVETIAPIEIAARKIDGKEYPIYYIDDAKLRKAGMNLNGYAYKGKIYIRLGLSEKIERAVFRHEVYHIEDTRKWLGKYGLEIRAHAHTLLHDPVGFLYVLVHSINNGYIKTFWRLYIRPHKVD